MSRRQKSPFITLDQVRVRVGERDLFKGDTWRIHHGEQWVVLGDNASGKSTLVNALGGQARVVGGEVWYHFACSDPEETYPMDGTVPEDAIAYVSQEAQRELATSVASYHQARWNAGDHPDAPTVRAYLRSETGASWQRIRRIAEQSDLAALLTRQVAQLSNGELRKLLLARALLSKPRMLVLDDPYAGLDVASRARLDHLIAELVAGPMQIVLVTQRAEEIPAGATHLILVQEGRIVAQGPRRAMAVAPQVKAFLARTGRQPKPKKAIERAGRAEASGTPVVELRNIRVAYGRTTILENLNWRVCAGERWLVVGPNGAGKTTLLSLLLGDNPQAYANDIRLFGRRRGSGESIWDLKKKIGWVAPEIQWHYDPQATLHEVVGSGFFSSNGLYQRLTRNQKKRVETVLEQVGLADQATHALSDCSAGEQRTALLGRALVTAPPLFVFDEPCQGLDPEHRARFHAVLDTILAEEQHTALYVSHHAEEVPATFEQVLELAQGRVVRCGKRNLE